jgi:hypothetical protein
MEAWKLPPKSKIYEALSAIADNRVNITSETGALVTSSSLDKIYTVGWSEDFTQITSNDNASYWQGYIGYPILTVLMVKGKVNFDRRITEHLAGIPWKKINKQFKNNYDEAIESVLDSLEEKGVDTKTLRKEIERIMTQLEQLSLKKMPKRTRSMPYHT